MRIVGIVASCCALAVAACGTQAEQLAEVSATPREVRLNTLLDDQLDMPRGFSDRRREGWRPPFRPRDGNCRKLFDAVAAQPGAGDLIASAAAAYEGAHVGETVGIGLSLYKGYGATGEVDRLQDAMRGCRVADSGGAGKGDRLRSTRLPLPDVGDGVTARRLTGRVGGYPYEMHLVVARSGATVITLVHGGVRSADVKGTEELTRLLAQRVSNL